MSSTLLLLLLGGGMMSSRAAQEDRGQDAASRLNAFGMALMKAGAPSTGNVLFSPISASAAMTLLRSASAGATQAELDKAMHTNGTAAAESGALLRSLTDTEGKEVTLANAIFAPPDMRIGESFTQEALSNFGATVERLRDSGAEGVAQINDWVATATKRRITHLVSSLDRESAVLLNAITFDGKWVTPFAPRQTKDSAFHAEGGDQEVPMMHRTGRMVYRDAGDHEEVSLPYRGGRFSMRILLPKAADPQKLLNGLSPTPPPPALAQSVDLLLPRFRYSFDSDLKAPLTKLGMGSIFSHADLSRMTPSGGGVRISKVLQRAWIELDEFGTKAAAATAVATASAIFGRQQPPIPFHVDHPFAFLIEDQSSGAILFAGIIRRVP